MKVSSLVTLVAGSLADLTVWKLFLFQRLQRERMRENSMLMKLTESFHTPKTDIRRDGLIRSCPSLCLVPLKPTSSTESNCRRSHKGGIFLLSHSCQIRSSEMFLLRFDSLQVATKGCTIWHGCRFVFFDSVLPKFLQHKRLNPSCHYINPDGGSTAATTVRVVKQKVDKGSQMPGSNLHKTDNFF